MSKFVQIHMISSYPPANVNRDDLGRPKTAVLGGKNRLRISSQCLKRTWRTSNVFQEALGNKKGFRTKELGKAIKESLTEGRPLWDVMSDKEENLGSRETVDGKTAKDWAGQIIEEFGDVDEGLQHSQLVFVTPEEIEKIDELLLTLIENDREPGDEELDLLRNTTKAVDVAMFGRMMAKKPDKSIEGATQVAHALSTHEVVVENDYFSAVEDLNQFREDAGAAHLGNREFASGLFYLYTAINRSLLERTLGTQKGKEGGGDIKELASRSIEALVKAMATETPVGMKNSYGSSTYASYALVEKGNKQPRNLSSQAFIDPVQGGDFLSSSIQKLKESYKRLDEVYGNSLRRKEMHVPAGEGTLEGVAEFAGDDNF